MRNLSLLTRRLTRPAAIVLTTLLLGLSLPISQTLWTKVLHITGAVNFRPTDEPRFEGCGLGFWKQPHHFDSWPDPYEPETPFEGIFGRDVPGDPTLLEALEQGGGHLQALMRQAVAALLNAAGPEVNYPLSVDDVLAKFQAAFDSGDYEPTKDEFETANEAGCPLNNEEPSATPTTTSTPTATLEGSPIELGSTEQSSPTASLIALEFSQGCLPAFWREPAHFSQWPAPYASEILFRDAFGGNAPGLLLEALRTQGGGAEALAREAAAALLNAVRLDLVFPLTEQEVISQFRAASDSADPLLIANATEVLGGHNAGACPLPWTAPTPTPPITGEAQPPTTDQPTPTPGL